MSISRLTEGSNVTRQAITKHLHDPASRSRLRWLPQYLYP